MRHFSAQYIFTNTSAPLKRGIITTEDDGTIVNLEDNQGNLTEKESVEFHNGLIIPGFVNCHCHTELSHMRRQIPRGQGLPEFIKSIRTTRETDEDAIRLSVLEADAEMYSEGIVLCADICNNAISFQVKKNSLIHYINLLEVFGIDPGRANHRLDEVIRLSEISELYGLPFSIVPHSAYSVSLPLFRLLRSATESNKITSIHFMETGAEKLFLERHSGPIMDSYMESRLVTGNPETVKSHSEAVLNEITGSGNLILVHNTCIDANTIKKVRKRGNLFWCLCPGSNLYIENKVPPVDLLINENCTIVTGTDSLASNSRLSILEELKTLQKFFPSVSLTTLVMWSSLNGAAALGETGQYGTIEPGKKPGLLLLQDIDMENMKLLPESNIKRLL